jgi:hypothetical protein
MLNEKEISSLCGWMDVGMNVWILVGLDMCVYVYIMENSSGDGKGRDGKRE